MSRHGFLQSVLFPLLLALVILLLNAPLAHSQTPTPTKAPTTSPSAAPTLLPTTSSPTTSSPTTSSPTNNPTRSPTTSPTASPTFAPSSAPTQFCGETPATPGYYCDDSGNVSCGVLARARSPGTPFPLASRSPLPSLRFFLPFHSSLPPFAPPPQKYTILELMLRPV